MDTIVKDLCRKIDDGLMELDYQLCQRAVRDGIPRNQVAVFGLKSQALAAMLAAFSKDENLWAEFSWEVGAPREPAFERLYQRAQSVGRCPSEANGTSARQQALEACDPNGLTRRINALAGDGQLDGLTVGAVSYVLGRKSALWKTVQAAVGQQKPS